MKRIVQLDGIRGLAIVLVLIAHYFRSQLLAPPGSLGWYVSGACKLSWSGVDLFFVLSGFLIAGILFDHRETSNFFRVFYLRRVCRIFPIYFALLGILVVLDALKVTTLPSLRWLFDNPLPYWSYATFSQNVLIGTRGGFWPPHWMDVTWSLAVEEQFYLVIPLLIYFASRRATLAILGTCVLLAPILRGAFPGFHAFVNTPWRADSLLSGACLALLVRWHPFVTFVRNNTTALTGLLTTLLMGAAIMTVRDDAFGAFDHFWLAGLYTVVVLIGFLGTTTGLGALLSFKPLVWLGNLSYGIYLFHQPVSGLMHGLIRGQAPQLKNSLDAAVTLSAVAVTLILATLSFRYIEGPIVRFGHRFEYRPKKPGERTQDANGE